MSNNISLLPSRIKEIRTNMGLTQKEFAVFINVSTVSVSSYETEAKSPSLDMLINIASKCNVSLDWLCGLSSIKSNLGKITTYPDLFRLFITILDTRYNEKPTSPIIDIINVDTENVVLTLHEDPNIQSFFSEWCKIFELHCKGTIDDELYQLWIDKELKKYEGHLINGLPL